MATTTSSTGIQFSGLFSGLDTDSIIKQLLNLDAAPQRALQTKKTMMALQKEALNTANSSLLSLQNSLKDFANGVLLGNKAVSDDEKVITASADASASQGTYNISVINMAYAHRVGSDAQAGNYVGGAADQFTVTVGGTAFNVTIANGDSLETVASKINNSTSGPTSFMDKALATVITNPGNGQKTLVIDSKTTGTSNAISIADTVGTGAQTLGLITGGGAIKNELQTAQDASVSINGVSITNSTNSITSALFGVTLNIEGFGSAEVTVGPDDDEVVSKVKAFVDQFNSTTDLFSAFTKEQKVADPQTTDELRRGILQNDSDLSMTKSNIRLKTTGYMDSTQTTYKILQSIGIDSEPMVGSTVSDNITLDEDKLRAALKDDKQQVADLLEGFATQMNDYLESQTKVTVAESMAGNFYRRILSIDSQTKNIDQEISNWDDRLAKIEQRYRDQFSAMETLLQQMQTQGNYLQQQLGNLTSSSSSSSKK